MLTALGTGAFFGLASGVAPGPLLALIIAQSLRYGAREGCKVALSPLATDAPIILLSLLVASKLAHLQLLLGVVSIAGGVFVLYLAWDSFRPLPQEMAVSAAAPRSWFKGILTNLLSPHPWLFWLTVGAALLAKAMGDNGVSAAAFLTGFYALLVGSKILIAFIAARSRALLMGTAYHSLLRILGVMLCCFAFLLFREGWQRVAAEMRVQGYSRSCAAGAERQVFWSTDHLYRWAAPGPGQ